MKRREFLIHMNSAALLALAGAIPGLTLFSPGAGADAGSPKKFFVLIRIPTGWDVTLGLDPQIQAQGNDENDMFIEYRPEDILAQGNIRLAPAAASLAPFASDLAVVNGIYMSDSNQSHDSNLDYISTGDQMGKSADLSVEVANATSAGPYGVIFNQNVKRASRMTMLSAASSIEGMQNSMDLSKFQSLILKMDGNSAFAKSRNTLMSTQDNKARLFKALDQFKPELDATKGNDLNSTLAHAASIAAACFLSQTAFQAQLDITTSLDAHASHPKVHLANQKAAWEAIAQVFQIFKATPAAQGTLFDQTTFMVVSEFSRTPALNAAQGKDHNPLTNSVLLAGAGVRGGQVIGQSELVPRRFTSNGEARHVGAPVDYTTGRVAATRAESKASNFQFIYPENVAATIAVIQGVDRNKFSSVAPDVRHLPTLIKS